MLCDRFPSQRKWGRGQFPDWHHLINTAQGRGSNWQTALDNKEQLATKSRSAKDDAKARLALADLPNTNVSCVMLGQLRSSCKWWALQESMQKIGLTQRFMFSFASGNKKPGPPSVQKFLSGFAMPIFKRLALEFFCLRTPASPLTFCRWALGMCSGAVWIYLCAKV